MDENKVPIDTSSVTVFGRATFPSRGRQGESGEGFGAMPAIGAEQIRSARDTLRRYKAGKANLERRIIENEQFWKLRHWEQMSGGSPGDPKPASAWLVNVVLNRHADAVDNYPEPNCLPRAADDADEAAKLSKILPVILKQNGFEQTYSDCWWYKLKAGTACYGVFWDGAKLNGLGDISIRKVDILNLFWEPGVTDIQQSRHLFHVELRDNDELLETYPQLAGKLGHGTETVSRFLYDDAVDVTGKTPVVDWYYHRRGLLHFCKFCGDTVLYASENENPDKPWYDHGKYPFVFDVLFPEEGTPCGFGYVDVCKNPQKQIDLMNQAVLKNTLAAATPRFFIRDDGAVNEAEFADWSRPFVHTNGNLGQDSILPISSTPLSGAHLSYLQMKVQELRDTSGNTETNTGAIPSGVTAASAIAALQEASGKLSRDMIQATYRSFEEICLMVIDLIRQFYDLPRQFRITGDMGAEEFTSYDNAGLRPRPIREFGVDMGYRSPVLDIEVAPQNESRYTKAEYNELALKLFAAGMFQPQLADQAESCLSMMDFKGRDQLLRKVRMNGTLARRLQAAEQALAALMAEREEETPHQSSSADAAADSFPSRGSLERSARQSLPPEEEGGAQRRMRATAEPAHEGSSAGSRPGPRGKAVSLSAARKESYATARARERSRDSARVR